MIKMYMLQDTLYSEELAVSHVAEIGKDILETGEKNLHERTDIPVFMQTVLWLICA